MSTDTLALPAGLDQDPLDGFPDPMPPGTATGDPDAPYGYTSDGAPRGKPGRKPTAPKPAAAPKPRAATSSTTRTPPAPGKKTAPKTPPKPKTTTVDYKPGIVKLVGEIAGTMAVAGLVRGSVVTIADAAVIESNAESIADLANTAADRFPVVATILDKVLTAAPLAAGAGALLLAAAQIAVNHGVIPAGMVPGTVAPDVLMNNYVQARAAQDESFMATLQTVMAARAAQQNAGTSPDA